MELPSKRFTIRDGEKNINYVLRSYRDLDKDEALQMLRVYLSGLKPRQRPKKNTTVEIITTIGLND